jgi:mannan endo-1,4-beta-mannosidase
MKYKKILFIIAFSAFTLAGCSDVDKIEPEPNNIAIPSADVKTLKLSDPQATAETKALYSNLWAIEQKGFMFGHHDDLMYGRYWYGDDGGSDTKAVCGDYPAVYSVDLAEVMDDRSLTAKSQSANEIRKRCITEARRRGEVIIACMHLNNPLTGGDSWDNSNKDVVAQILTQGSATNQKFNTWLERLVVFVNSLKDDKGNPIPMIFRPFHEHTQSWSWWGSSCTTEQQFIDLWRYTVNYLRNAGIYQFIYAIAPQMDTPKTENDFLYRWPGDDYVDFIGMDAYQGLTPEVFSRNMRTLASVAAKKQKPCGVTETGVEGFTDKKYWTEQILTPAENRHVSMIVTWRNKFVDGNESDKHYYSVYPGHPSADDFIRFYNDPTTFFSSDLPDMYTMADGMEVN